MKSVRTTLATVAAAMLIAFGLLALLNPWLAVRWVGLEIVEPRGLTEVRATFGGLFTALGGAMLWAIPTRPRSRGWIRLAAVAFSVVATVRVVSLILDGAPSPLNLAFTAGTGFVAVALVLAGFQDVTAPPRRHRRPVPAPAAGAPQSAPRTAPEATRDRPADAAPDAAPDRARGGAQEAAAEAGSTDGSRS